MTWIKVISINSALVLCILLIVEFFFGSWSYDDYPNLEFQIFNKTYIDRSSLEIEPKIVTLYPHSNGFRLHRDTNLEKIRECLVITMGGSTTQEFILSQNETWSQKLQDELNNNSSINKNCYGNYVVMNLGMSGHSISSNYWLLKNYIRDAKLNPLAIIVFQGINDWHESLNTETKYIFLRHLKQELIRDMKYNSFTYDLIRKVKNNKSINAENNSANKKFNDDGYLFKISKPKKLIGNLEYIKLNNNLIQKTNLWGGVLYHKDTIEKFIDFGQKFLPETKLIFITQTKPICDLRKFPAKLGYMKIINENPNIDFSSYTPKDWHSDIGVCLRLGLVKNSYLSFDNQKSNIKVIDYAGSFLEGTNESYDHYHKTPYGSLLFFNRVKKQLICEIVGCPIED
tara:strand:- start:772 stop:1968 length:1197 start_codon:yes stop_codon:yes gene_type:complete